MASFSAADYDVAFSFSKYGDASLNILHLTERNRTRQRNKRVKIIPRSCRKRTACCQASHSGELSAASSAGRRKGTSAPYSCATFAMASLSVDTIIFSTQPLANLLQLHRQSTAYRIEGGCFYGEPFRTASCKDKSIYFHSLACITNSDLGESANSIHAFYKIPNFSKLINLFPPHWVNLLT